MASNTGHKRLVHCKSGLRVVELDALHSCLFVLQEPRWIPDSECVQCPQCRSKFDLFTRKHHCRRCGKCYCAKCCGKKMNLPRFGFVDPVRVCSECEDPTKKENDFFEKKLKILLKGVRFEMDTPFSPPHEKHVEQTAELIECKLSSNHRQLDLQKSPPTQDGLGEIFLENIDAVKVLTPGGVSPVSSVSAVNGMALTYKDAEGNNVTSRFLIPDNDSDKFAGVAFIVAFQVALRMVFEKRSLTQRSAVSCSIETSKNDP